MFCFPADSTLQGRAPDGPFAGRRGRHAAGHTGDFKALQKHILEGSALLCKMEASLRSLIVPALQEFSRGQVSSQGAKSATGQVTLKIQL